MPGIVGFFEPKDSGQNIVGLLEKMAKTIKHEDFQKTDFLCMPPLSAARVYIDSNNSSQPVFNEDKTLCIFMDGSVYGFENDKKFLESRKHKFSVGSDAEFCLHMFEEYGSEFVKKLNGSFVILIYNVVTGTLLIANDRYGMKQLYYSLNGKRLLFSSEVKAILEDKTISRQMDHRGVASFFAFGRILGDGTFFSSIKLLPPATVLNWSDGKIEMEQYWNFSFKDSLNPELDEEYYANHLARLFKRAVLRRARKHRLGVFLSGGLDSRLIISAIPRKNHQVKAVTYGVPKSDELKIARKIAKTLEIDHQFVELQKNYLVECAEKGVYLTDGMLNCAHFWWLPIIPDQRKDVDVMFHGTGLDILLSSQWYGTMQSTLTKASKDLYPSVLFAKINSYVPLKMMPSLFSSSYGPIMRKSAIQLFKDHLSKGTEKDPIDRTDAFFLRAMGRNYLSSVILDNYSEHSAPGIDNDFFDFLLTVPRSVRCNSQRLYFLFLSKLSPKLGKIAYQRTGVAPTAPILVHRIGFLIKGGSKVLNLRIREKTRGKLSFPLRYGYPDLGDWIRHDEDLRAYFVNVLLSKRTLERGYFNPTFINRIVEDHISGKKDWTMLLCALLTFELWNRLFIDNTGET